MKIIALNGIVGWDIMAKDINAQIDDADGELIFDMNSGGGYITEGVAILNKIRSYKGGKTIARVSYSASMMTQIALACDEVHVYDNAIFMVHNAQGFASGDHNEMSARAKHLKSMSGMLAQLYVKKTGKSKKDIQAMMDETTYMFGQEIVDEGFADTVIESDDEDKDSALAIQAGELNFAESMKAMKEEGLSALELGETLKVCESGKCDVNLHGSKTPSDASSEKIVNSPKGKTVKKTPEELQKLLNTANTTIESNKTSIDGKDVEITALNDKITAFEASALEQETIMAKAVSDGKDEAKKELQDEFKGIMAMVLEVNAPKEVALDLVACETLDKAKTKLADSMTSAGVTFGGENNQPNASADNHGWGKIMKKGK